MKKIVFITPQDVLYGFRLAGIEQRTAGPDAADAELRDALAGPDNGLVIIDERLLTDAVEERIREAEHGWPGILLVLPSPLTAPPEVEDYAARLIRKAIGYHVRLNV
jgi:V/A-type H+/Na+-transporting ATPase subunit F